MKNKKQTSAASREHDKAMVELLKKDPAFATEYLAAALENAGGKDGQYALLKALKQIAEAQGIAKVAKKAGIPRESFYRAFSEKGNPRLTTLQSVVGAMGLRLSVQPV